LTSFNVGTGTRIYDPVVILKENHEIEIGKNCSIGQFTFIGARKLVMKEGAEICPHVVLAGGGDITLGEYSTLCFGAKLIPATETTEGKYMNDICEPDLRKIIRGSIMLGEGAYVGSNAVICVSKKCPNIRIGNYAVVGALSYLDHSIADHTVVHPAKQHHISCRRMEYKK